MTVWGVLLRSTICAICALHTLLGHLVLAVCFVGMSIARLVVLVVGADRQRDPRLTTYAHDERTHVLYMYVQ